MIEKYLFASRDGSQRGTLPVALNEFGACATFRARLDYKLMGSAPHPHRARSDEPLMQRPCVDLEIQFTKRSLLAFQAFKQSDCIIVVDRFHGIVRQSGMH